MIKMRWKLPVLVEKNKQIDKLLFKPIQDKCSVAEFD